LEFAELKDPVQVCGKTGTGRFGWNADTNDIKTFVESEFANEIGISAQAVGRDQILSIVSFIRMLAPPPTKALPWRAIEGREVFQHIGCNRCHLESLHTTVTAPPYLRSKVFHAYTDLRVHDVVNDPHLPCDERFIRTAPLWGLSSEGPPFWHDGSAMTIDQAIMKHHGEADKERRAYEALNRIDKTALLSFIQYL
jgi:CxxC motif-containing protein (DUF1111 family)